MLEKVSKLVKEIQKILYFTEQFKKYWDIIGSNNHKNKVVN